MFIFWWIIGPAWQRYVDWRYKRKHGVHKAEAFQSCPRCGCDYDVSDEPYFKYTDSGTSYCPGEPSIHWFHGISTCPRCRHSFGYSDSD